MTGEVLARRYASALIDLSLEEKVADEVGVQLAAFAGEFEKSGLSKALINPALDLDDKMKLLDEVSRKLKLKGTLKNFLMLLLEKKRISELKAINELFQTLLDEKTGRVKAEVVLPEKASAAELEEITRGLEKSTGKKVVVDVRVDPAILGGVVAKVGSVVYDGSIRTQLENIKNNIMRG